MRILLTNNHLARFGGSETWTLTMARELIRQGHDVGVYTREKGVISNLLKYHLDNNPQDYDLAIINHKSCAHVDAKKKIFTSHGIYHGLEEPPAGMDVYVAVSENVAKRHNIDIIIKNPIDTNHFKPTSSIRETPDRILSIVEGDIPLEAIKPSREKETMAELMNQSDLVVTIGRGVLEAMSCARNVIVYDTRLGGKMDGYLTLPITGNVGGEYRLQNIDWKAELEKYNKEHGERNREYILKYHDVRNVVEQYLNL